MFDEEITVLFDDSSNDLSSSSSEDFDKMTKINTLSVEEAWK